MDVGEAPWKAEDANTKPQAKQLYEKYVADGLTQKDAAKLAQEQTGVSVVSGREISKKVEFTPKGKTKYGGQYADGTAGRSKRWKPAAWPQ